MIKQCTSCKWTFERTHSDTCPSCGGTTVEHDEVHQGSWLALSTKRASERLELEAEQVKCCWTAQHTRGFHHESNCPKYVMCY